MPDESSGLTTFDEYYPLRYKDEEIQLFADVLGVEITLTYGVWHHGPDIDGSEDEWDENFWSLYEYRDDFGITYGEAPDAIQAWVDAVSRTLKEKGDV